MWGGRLLVRTPSLHDLSATNRCACEVGCLQHKPLSKCSDRRQQSHLQRQTDAKWRVLLSKTNADIEIREKRITIKLLSESFLPRAFTTQRPHDSRGMLQSCCASLAKFHLQVIVVIISAPIINNEMICHCGSSALSCFQCCDEGMLIKAPV